MEPNEFLAVLEKLRQGYNNMDVSMLEAALAENLTWAHRNHWKVEGRATVIQMMKDFVAKMPVRSFGDIGRFAVEGDIAVVEQKWHVIPNEDIPAWKAKQGVPFSLDMCSVFVVKDGKIVDWSDFC